MPNKDRNIPKRRFKEFENEDAWELRKLGELAEIVRGASPRPIQDPKWFDEQSEIGWLRISDVTEQDGRIYHLEQKISKLGQQKTRVLVEPHLLLSIAATVGKPVVNYVKTGVHDGFLIFLEPRFEQEFMFQWLEMFRSSWSKYGQPGSQVNLNSDLVKNQELSIPTHPEQEAIGTFFSTLDRHITLHQRKLDKLKHVKQAYLSEMFPAEGERVPKRRFPGFTDDWELRKLGEITEKQFGGGTPTTSNALFWEGNIPWIQSSDLEEGIFSVGPRKYITKDGLGNSSAQLIPKNSIAIVTRVGVGKLAFMPFTYTTSQDFLSISYLKTNELFTTYSLYIKLQNEIKVLQGTSIKGITKNELLIKEIPIPSFPEQEAIGTFFSTLDRHITLHQRKLEKLKNLKKALLNELFV
ncbi:TPA: restriction endonuclease subunit S [Streptococcus suis]